MKKLNYIFWMIFLLVAQTQTQAQDSANNQDAWFLKAVLKASAIYNTPYKDPSHKGEPRRTMERTINNLNYKIARYNHGLAHAVRQAYMAERIINELRDDESIKTDLARFLRKLSDDEQDIFKDKVMLLALYYRAGRQNEFSPSGGTEEEKARFDENMREGAKLFVTAALDTGLFEDDEEIQVYVEPFFHYEFDRQGKKFKGIAQYIDQILYAGHLLDVRRVNASWNKPGKGPKEILPLVSEALGFNKRVLPIVKRLSQYSGKLLKATGDRDAWVKRITLSDEFFFQAYAPELMLIKIKSI